MHACLRAPMHVHVCVCVYVGVWLWVQVRSLKLEQECEKNQILSEALQTLATEHHELEQSVATGTPPGSTLSEEEFYDAVSGRSMYAEYWSCCLNYSARRAKMVTVVFEMSSINLFICLHRILLWTLKRTLLFIDIIESLLHLSVFWIACW